MARRRIAVSLHRMLLDWGRVDDAWEWRLHKRITPGRSLVVRKRARPPVEYLRRLLREPGISPVDRRAIKRTIKLIEDRG